MKGLEVHVTQQHESKVCKYLKTSLFIKWGPPTTPLLPSGPRETDSLHAKPLSNLIFSFGSLEIALTFIRNLKMREL